MNLLVIIESRNLTSSKTTQGHFAFHNLPKSWDQCSIPYTHALLGMKQKYNQDVFHTSVPKDASMIIIHTANKQELNGH